MCERLLRCAIGARLMAARLEGWQSTEQNLLDEIDEHACGGLGETVPKRVAARVLEVNVSTLDRWIARGALDTGSPPGSTRQELATEMVIELACILKRVRYRPPDAFRRALGEVWQERLKYELDRSDALRGTGGPLRRSAGLSISTR